MKTLLFLGLLAAVILAAVVAVKYRRAAPAVAATPSAALPAPAAATGPSVTGNAPVFNLPPRSGGTTTAVPPARQTPAAPAYLQRLLNGEVPQPGKNAAVMKADGAPFSSQPNLQRLIQTPAK